MEDGRMCTCGASGRRYAVSGFGRVPAGEPRPAGAVDVSFCSPPAKDGSVCHGVHGIVRAATQREVARDARSFL